MALAPCRECSAQISTTARTCPSCGVARPAAASTGREFGRDALLAVLVLAAVIAIVLILAGVL